MAQSKGIDAFTATVRPMQEPGKAIKLLALMGVFADDPKMDGRFRW